MKKINYNNLADFLKSIRIKKGLTIVDCSIKLGSKNGNPSAWARYENGDCKPSLQQVKKLLGVLGCENVVISFE